MPTSNPKVVISFSLLYFYCSEAGTRGQGCMQGTLVTQIASTQESMGAPGSLILSRRGLCSSSPLYFTCIFDELSTILITPALCISGPSTMMPICFRNNIPRWHRPTIRSTGGEFHPTPKSSSWTMILAGPATPTCPRVIEDNLQRMCSRKTSPNWPKLSTNSTQLIAGRS